MHMNDFPLVISYYTKETLYQLEVQNLIASCENWGIEYHVEGISSFGTWERNCAYKPFFLLEQLQKWKRALFWVDADAVFMKKPQWSELFASDFAVRINELWDDAHPSKVMSGSLYINATQGGERVLKAWAKECLDRLSDPNRTEELWDQVALRDVLKKGVPEARVVSLPAGYTFIVGHPCDEKEIEEVIIGHYQASRRLKKIINEGN
jgi:hypothetical protein